MATQKRYSLPYWVKVNRGYDFARKDMAEAIQIYTEQRGHPDIDFDGTPLEFANALYSEYHKRGKPYFGAFFTPLDVAARMADSLGIGRGMTVLDPCAGIGNLLHAVGNRGGYGVGWELQVELVDIAGRLGMNITYGDGLAADGVKPDAIIINPPFGKMQGHADIAVEFMRRAAEYGVPVAAILPRGWLDKTDRKHREVAALYRVLDQEELPPETFKPLTSIATTRYLLKAA